jgi:hypothetical protein
VQNYNIVAVNVYSLRLKNRVVMEIVLIKLSQL